MCCALRAKLGLLLLVLIALLMVCGCETVSAVKTGDVRMKDLVQIAQLGSSSPRPFHQPRSAGANQPAGVFDFQKIDSWFQANLW